MERSFRSEKLQKLKIAGFTGFSPPMSLRHFDTFQAPFFCHFKQDYKSLSLYNIPGKFVNCKNTKMSRQLKVI